MSVVLKRHSKSALQAGRVPLPKRLEALSRLPFVWLLQRKSKSKSAWRVEITSATALYLIQIFDELQELKEKHKALSEAYANHDSELEKLREENAQLNINVERISANFKEDKHQKHQKSPKKTISTPQKIMASSQDIFRLMAGSFGQSS